MIEKNIALLYSAIGADPEDVPGGEASERAMEILEEAGRSNGWEEQ